MDDKRICFVTCVNDDRWYQESLLYINKLIVPDGYSIETVAVKDAVSMTSGLNAGMRRSPAKYKVYLHQDVFIINRNFISNVLKIFEDDAIGMIGVAGSQKLPQNGIWWEDDTLIGKTYDSHRGKMEALALGDPAGAYSEVACIDGLLMMTQYDLPWREDLFTGWHFYDLSQSLEFRRQAYKIVIPQQPEAWCIHDSGPTFVTPEYHQYRQIFINEYLTARG